MYAFYTVAGLAKMPPCPLASGPTDWAPERDEMVPSGFERVKTAYPSSFLETTIFGPSSLLILQIKTAYSIK